MKTRQYSLAGARFDFGGNSSTYLSSNTLTNGSGNTRTLPTTLRAQHLNVRGASTFTQGYSNVKRFLMYYVTVVQRVS